MFISAGELSGDIVGARLVAELRRRDPRTRFAGTGGARLAAAGVEIIHDTNDIGVVGVTEVAKTAPGVIAAYRAIRRAASGEPFRCRGVDRQRCLQHLPGALAAPARHSHRVVISTAAVGLAIAGALDGAELRRDCRVFSRRAGRSIRELAPGPVRFVGHYLADDLQPVDADARSNT